MKVTLQRDWQRDTDDIHLGDQSGQERIQIVVLQSDLYEFEWSSLKQIYQALFNEIVAIPSRQTADPNLSTQGRTIVTSCLPYIFC